MHCLFKQNIFNLTYPPGSQINYNELQETLGISNTPIKDALIKLAGEGLVEINARRGTYVKNVSMQDIEEIFETRMMLEVGAAETIARGITKKQIAKLESFF